MHARGYETVSTRIRSGAIVLSKLDIPQGRHALDVIAVGLVTGLLDSVAKLRRVQKGHLLWHSPLDKPGHPRPDLLRNLSKNSMNTWW